MKIDFSKLTDEQFEHIIDVLILYKTFNKGKDVYLNEKSIKEAFYFMESIKGMLKSNPNIESKSNIELDTD